MTATPIVLVDHSDPAVVTVTMNRPEKRNALSIALIERLTETVNAAARDPNARVVVLRGNGPAFCAGLDLAEAADPRHADRSAEVLSGLYLAICRSPLVVIAAARGAALGGGGAAGGLRFGRRRRRPEGRLPGSPARPGGRPHHSATSSAARGPDGYGS